MALFGDVSEFSVHLFVVQILDEDFELVRCRVVVVRDGFDSYNALKPFYLEFGQLLLEFAEYDPCFMELCFGLCRIDVLTKAVGLPMCLAM